MIPVASPDIGELEEEADDRWGARRGLGDDRALAGRLLVQAPAQGGRCGDEDLELPGLLWHIDRHDIGASTCQHDRRSIGPRRRVGLDYGGWWGWTAETYPQNRQRQRSIGMRELGLDKSEYK